MSIIDQFSPAYIGPARTNSARTNSAHSASARSASAHSVATRTGRTAIHGSRPRALRVLPGGAFETPFAEFAATTSPVAGTRPGEAWHQAYRRRLVAADVAAAVVAASVAASAGLTATGPSSPLSYAASGVAVIGVWLGALSLAGGYEARFLGASTAQFGAVGKALVGLLSMLAIATMLAQVSLSRSFLVPLVALLPLLSVMARAVLRRWLRVRRTQGELMQSTVIIGGVDATVALVRSLQNDPTQGLAPVALCTLGDGVVDPLLGVAHVATEDAPLAALAAVDALGADVVVVTAHAELSGPALRQLAWALEDRGVELIVAPGLMDIAGPRMSLRPSQDLALLHVEHPGGARRHIAFKAAFDRVMALLLILAFSPVLVASWLAIRLTSAGPAFFRQQRIGKGGQPFTIYKFRTMVVDADARQAALLHLSEGNAVQFKMKNDPRVTRVGQLLRSYSIDELPQLFNVLLGTMSLVGPRPQLDREVAQYGADASRRLNVLPGMTGLWQVSGRSDLSWDQTVRLDLRYVDNWSPTFDAAILLRTFRAVFAGSGAY